MSNLDAVTQTLDELRRMGRIEPVDSALVEAARTMAAALDEQPGNAQLWKAYRDTLEVLTDDSADDDDKVAALLAELSAPAGDAEAP